MADVVDDSSHDPTRHSTQPRAEPHRDAPILHPPRSISVHEAARLDFETAGLKSSAENDCVKCSAPGSTFPCCNEVICDKCATWFYPPDGHALEDHFKPQPVPIETEFDRLVREHRDLLVKLNDPVKILRTRNADLRRRLEQLEKDKAGGAR